MSEQCPAIVAPPDGRYTVKNRVLLIPTQSALADNNGVDEALLGLNGTRYGTLRPKQVRQKSVRCNQLRIGPRWFVGDGRRLTHTLADNDNRAASISRDPHATTKPCNTNDLLV
jgi:hypothetical protein